MLKSICRLSCVFLLLFCASLWGQSVADVPIKAIETNLVLAERIGGEIAWIDNENFLATVLPNDAQFGNWWVRRVVSVNARSGETTEFLSQGFVSCSNAAAGLVGVSSGTLAYQYEGGSKELAPVPHLYRKTFGSGKLVQLAKEEEWNKWICIKTRKSDLNRREVVSLEKELRYLQTPDDLLLTVQAHDRQISNAKYDMILQRGNERIPVPGLSSSEGSVLPQFLPFKNEHLISSGRVMRSGYILPAGQQTQEVPTITMTKEGRIERKYVSDELLKMGFDRDANVLPYAKGNLLFAVNYPQYGGGIYRTIKNHVERVWCVNTSGNNRPCEPKFFSLSPNGCYLAFYSESSDEPRGKRVLGVSLKILDVCK
jgi:hypothetical protein